MDNYYHSSMDAKPQIGDVWLARINIPSLSGRRFTAVLLVEPTVVLDPAGLTLDQLAALGFKSRTRWNVIVVGTEDTTDVMESNLVERLA